MPLTEVAASETAARAAAVAAAELVPTQVAATQAVARALAAHEAALPGPEPEVAEAVDTADAANAADDADDADADVSVGVAATAHDDGVLKAVAAHVGFGHLALDLQPREVAA